MAGKTAKAENADAAQKKTTATSQESAADKAAASKTETRKPARAKTAKAEIAKAAGEKPEKHGISKIAEAKTSKAKAPKASKAGERKAVKTNGEAAKITDWTKSPQYAKLYEALEYAVLSAKGELNALSYDRLDEYMDLWCQRKMLTENIRKIGPVVCDERGRQSENRCISLALQTSRQMLELYKAMGLAAEADHAGNGGGRRSDAENATEDDDDEL